MNPQPLLTAAETCHRLQISRAHLYRLTRDGLLRPVRFGRSIRFRPVDIESLINDCLTMPDPDAHGLAAGIGAAA